jgi:hypothetical protein
MQIVAEERDAVGGLVGGIPDLGSRSAEPQGQDGHIEDSREHLRLLCCSGKTLASNIAPPALVVHCHDFSTST